MSENIEGFPDHLDGVLSNAADTRIIAELGALAAAPLKVDPNEQYAVPDGEGGVKLIATKPATPTLPLYAKASRTVTEARSFADYVIRHGSDYSEIWADAESSRVVAIIDAHLPHGEAPDYEHHRITLALRKTKAWEEWTSIDGKFLPQVEFADFIEQHAIDVLADVDESKFPSSARLLELAQTFQANTKVEFKSGTRLQSGETQLQYEETVQAKAGQKGRIEIPKELQLALRPYVDGPIYFIYASFRYRIQPGGLYLGISLRRPQDVLDGAFADVVKLIRDGGTDAESKHYDGVSTIDAPIFTGRP